MTDLYHEWGGGLYLSATGDLLTVDGPVKGRQRVLRRLLSNPATEEAPGDLVFDPEFGGGLPRRAGSTNSPTLIGNVTRRQMFLEDAVSHEPPPEVKVEPFFGGMTVRISYNDKETGEAVRAGFSIDR